MQSPEGTAYVTYTAGRWQARWWSRDDGRYYTLELPKIRDGGYTFAPALPEDYPIVKRALERRGYCVVRVA